MEITELKNSYRIARNANLDKTKMRTKYKSYFLEEREITKPNYEERQRRKQLREEKKQKQFEVLHNKA